MKRILSALLLSAVVTGCSITNDWHGTSLAKKSHASFGEFSGKQTFKLSPHPDSSMIRIRYGMELKAGEMRMIVKSLKQEIIDVSTSNVLERSLEIKNLAGSGLDVTLIGKKARGSYHIEVVEN